MVPSGASARQYTAVILASCSRSVLTARDSFTSPRLVATVLLNLPFLNSASVVWFQCEAPVAKASGANAQITKNRIQFLMENLGQEFTCSAHPHFGPADRACRAYQVCR